MGPPKGPFFAFSISTWIHPLMVFRGIGKPVDSILVNQHPIAGTVFLADHFFSFSADISSDILKFSFCYYESSHFTYLNH
jgi:hypothetical protein